MESQDVLNARLNLLPTTTCPNCLMVWLAPGLQIGDTYECKNCELSFVVGIAKVEDAQQP